MSKIIEFPSNSTFPKNEWNCHIKFLIKSFELANYSIRYNNKKQYAPGLYPIKINNKLIYIDHADHPDNNWYKPNQELGGIRYNPINIQRPIFKRCMHTKFKYSKNTYPLGPLYLKDIKHLQTLLSIGNIYNPYNSDKIIHTGKVYAGANYTRKPIFNQINKGIFDKTILPTLKHWQRFSNCISSLNISGATKYTLDPGQLEPMFLGICIIANDIDSYLPYFKKLDKNLHYVCLNDFLNINECIDYVYQNRDECKEKGEAVYSLLHNTCTPKPMTDWIIKTTEKYYE